MTKRSSFTRRQALKFGGAASVAIGAPTIITRNAWGFTNDPGSAGSVKLGFNVPQTGAYADEGADELRAYKLAVKHINGEGDGGMLNTMKPLALKGNGLLARIRFNPGRILRQRRSSRIRWAWLSRSLRRWRSTVPQWFSRRPFAATP